MKLVGVVMEVYRKMYREASPSADIDKLIHSGVTLESDWFLEYYLPQERQIEIVDEVCKKHRLTKRESNSVSVEVFLGCAPRGHRKGDKV